MIAADIAGVILGFVIDILPIRRHDGPVGWAIWLVMGVLARILS